MRRRLPHLSTEASWKRLPTADVDESGNAGCKGASAGDADDGGGVGSGREDNAGEAGGTLQYLLEEYGSDEAESRTSARDEEAWTDPGDGSQICDADPASSPAYCFPVVAVGGAVGAAGAPGSAGGRGASSKGTSADNSDNMSSPSV